MDKDKNDFYKDSYNNYKILQPGTKVFVRGVIESATIGEYQGISYTVVLKDHSDINNEFIPDELFKQFGIGPELLEPNPLALYSTEQLEEEIARRNKDIDDFIYKIKVDE